MGRVARLSSEFSGQDWNCCFHEPNRGRTKAGLLGGGFFGGGAADGSSCRQVSGSNTPRTVSVTYDHFVSLADMTRLPVRSRRSSRRYCGTMCDMKSANLRELHRRTGAVLTPVLFSNLCV